MPRGFDLSTTKHAPRLQHLCMALISAHQFFNWNMNGFAVQGMCGMHFGTAAISVVVPSGNTSAISLASMIT
jgi:hypothetical protein